MEMSDSDQENSDDTYVFLDFNGKLSTDLLGDEVFMRIVNLHKKNPLVQVKDSVFKGTYDYSLGTNLFFEEIEDPNSRDAFEKQTPIHLKHILSEMKVMSLKPIKIPQRKVVVPNEITKLNYNLDWDYNVLLEKFENGSLHLDDIMTKECHSRMMAPDSQEQCSNKEFDIVELMNVDENEHVTEERPQDEEYALENIVPAKLLESKYEKLNILARRPTKRLVSPELVEKCDEKYEQAYEYHNIERQILQPCDAFRTEKVTEVNEATLSDCVDIDRCVLQGILPPSSLFPRILSRKEKEAVLTLENFDNLSLAARYFVLKNHVQDLEDYIAKVPKSVLMEVDEFGRTPEDTLRIYKKLAGAVLRRIQEIKTSIDHRTTCDSVLSDLCTENPSIEHNDVKIVTQVEK